MTPQSGNPYKPIEQKNTMAVNDLPPLPILPRGGHQPVGGKIMKHVHGLHEIMALDFCWLRPYISNNRLREMGPTRKEVTIPPSRTDR
jgi:hypothetical protein